MIAWKRILALTLSIAMIFGCLSVGSFATNEAFDFVVTKVEKYSEETHASLEGEIASAKPGEVIVATVSIVNNTDEDVEVGSYGVGLKYDEKVLTPYTDSAAPKKTPFCKGISYDVSGSNFIAGVKEQGLVKPTGATADGVTVEGRSSTELGKIAFKVAANAEKANTLFQIDDTLDDNELSNCDKVALTFKAGEPFSLFINGVAPTLDKVTVTDESNNIVLDTSNNELRFDTLVVNGTRNYTYQAHAWSTSGKEITGNVTWKFKVGSELRNEFRGATIDETTGQIIIPKDASTDVSGTTFSMSVVAQAKEGVTAESDIETNLIQVQREKYRIAEIQISRKNNETGALIIPGTGEAAATAEFVATCTNQYGRPYEGDQTVYWNYERVGSQYSVKNVDFINKTATGATLKAEAGAADSVTDSATLKVKVYAGDINDRVYSNEVKITVQRDTVQRPAKIEISGGPEGSTLAVPKTNTAATATYTATVYDQYGTEITNPGTIEWKLRNESTGDTFSQKGVTIDQNGQNGVVTVTKEAAGNPFFEGTRKPVYIEATCGDATERTSFTLTREKATVTTLKITGSDTLEVPTKSEYPDGQITPYPVTIYDQYGVEMNSDNYNFGRELETTGVSDVIFQPAGVKVTCYAAGNQFDQNNTLTFTIKASCLGKEATKTITLTRQQSEATAITYHDTETTVVPTDDAQVPTKATPAVEDQYGLLMNNAKVEPNGELPTGIVLENGELYITKAAVKHFGGERKDEVQVFVNLKCAPAENTAKLKLKLAAAQINKDSAEITGPASIAKPTGEPNTAEYSISDVIKDQYGLRMQNVDRSKLSLKLYSDQACVTEVTGAPVTLSGKTITVTSGAVVNTKYYLKAYYNDQPCSDAKTITITNKQEGAPLTVVQGDITYGETVNPSVSNKPAGAGAITYTYVGRDGTTYNSSDAPTNAGKYTVTATCEDANYIYTGSTQFQILPKEIKVDWIELTNDEYTYNGREQTVKYTVKDGNTTLVKGRDYTVEGDKQTNAGVHRLKIIGKGNYTSNFTAAAGAPSVTWNIWGLPVRISTATFQSRAYAKDNYSAELDALTLVAAEDGVTMPDTLTAENGFTVSDIRVTNNNAGRQPVSFKVTLTNTNYKWAVAETGNTFDVDERAGFKVEITPADHAPVTVPPVSGKYGNQLAMDLAQYLEGGSAAVGTITDNENILDAVEGGAKAIVQNGKLWLQLTKNPTKVGKSATVTLTVESTNYNDFTITVTVTAQKKETQTITASDLNVTYGDAGVKLNASALGNAKLTYRVTEGAAVIAVDANGNVTLRKSGTAKIQITAAETEDYGIANTTVTVTVAKRSLTVKANDLTAYVGGQLPALDYTVTGLVSGETLTTVPELELKDVPAGVEPMKTAGTYTIGFKTAPVADKDKYDLTVETGTLTVSSRPNVNPVPAGNSVKLEEAAGGKLTSSVSRATKGTTVTITVKPDAGYQLEELEVLDKNGEALPLKELANGKFSFQMPDSKVTVQASFVQESTYAGYPDVLPQDWFYSSVRYVTERGLMNGTPNGFEPNMDSSRATIWTILARFSGVDTTVVSGEWYAVARQWAMENGVSDGTNPNGVITREQLATMLYRFAKNKGLVQEPVTADLSVFVDAGQISDYALDAMRWAVSVGLLNGMDGSRLAPQGSAARAQVAAMLMRFDQLAK